MKSTLAQDATKSAKSLAQMVAKQMAKEPFEVLKRVPAHVVGAPEATQSQENGSNNQAPTDFKTQKEVLESNDKIKSGRRIEALDRELKDIRRERLFKEIQRKIAEGIQVYLEEYPELSLEQKQVLNAQIEAVKAQMIQKQNAEQNQGLMEPTSKKGRRLFGFGQKSQVKKQQTKIEKPMSPSG